MRKVMLIKMFICKTRRIILLAFPLFSNDQTDVIDLTDLADFAIVKYINLSLHNYNVLKFWKFRSITSILTVAKKGRQLLIYP